MKSEEVKDLSFCIRCGFVVQKEFYNHKKCPVCEYSNAKKRTTTKMRAKGLDDLVFCCKCGNAYDFEYLENHKCPICELMRMLKALVKRFEGIE